MCEDNKQTILDAKKIYKKVLIKVLNIQFDKIFNINIYIYILPKNNFSLFNSFFLHIISQRQFIFLILYKF